MEKPRANREGRVNLRELVLFFSKPDGFDELVQTNAVSEAVYGDILQRVRLGKPQACGDLDTIAHVLSPSLAIYDFQVNEVMLLLLTNLFLEESRAYQKRIRDGVVFLRAVATD